MSDERRVHAVIPTAENLVNAVVAGDAPVIASILETCADRDALAVVLAAMVALRQPNPNEPLLYSEAERRAHHAAYQRGEEDFHTLLGEREYRRGIKRQQRSPRRVCDPATTDVDSPLKLDGQWITRGGISRFIPTTEQASRP